MWNDELSSQVQLQAISAVPGEIGYLFERGKHVVLSTYYHDTNNPVR